jgi:hypothetical protein
MPLYTVRLEFHAVAAPTPQAAAHAIQRDLEEDGYRWTYTVISPDGTETMVDTAVEAAEDVTPS